MARPRSARHPRRPARGLRGQRLSRGRGHDLRATWLHATDPIPRRRTRMLSRSALRSQARVNPDRIWRGRCARLLPTPAVPLVTAISATWMVSINETEVSVRVDAAGGTAATAVARLRAGPRGLAGGHGRRASRSWCWPPALRCSCCHAAPVPAGSRPRLRRSWAWRLGRRLSRACGTALELALRAPALAAARLLVAGFGRAFAGASSVAWPPCRPAAQGGMGGLLRHYRQTGGWRRCSPSNCCSVRWCGRSRRDPALDRARAQRRA